MSCPSLGPKWFWTIQIVLDGYKFFWSGPNHFRIFWTNFYNLDPTKENWTRQLKKNPAKPNHVSCLFKYQLSHHCITNLHKISNLFLTCYHMTNMAAFYLNTLWLMEIYIFRVAKFSYQVAMFCFFISHFVFRSQPAKFFFPVKNMSNESSLTLFSRVVAKGGIRAARPEPPRYLADQLREHSYMTPDVFRVFLTYLPTQIRCFTT